MDGSYFAFGLLGLLGYIVGDFQRQRRYTRDARSNLALANQRAIDRRNSRANVNRNGGTFANSRGDLFAFSDGDDRTDSEHDGDDDGKFYLDQYRQAGRRAISRPDYRPRVGSHVAGGDSHVSDEAAIA